VFDARATAAAYGLAVELADLGGWGETTLIAEYDARARAIRINSRALETYRRRCGRLSPRDVREFIDFAVAHELFHHREAIGEEPRRGSYAEREAAADAFARAIVAPNARLAAFVGGASETRGS
jgi:hypothetical protein